MNIRPVWNALSSASRRTLLLLAAVIVITVLRLVMGAPETQRSTGLPAPPLAGLVPANVTAVELSRGEETVSLVRDGEAWNVAAPVADRADGAKVRTLLEGLRDLRPTRVVSERGTDRDRYDLGAKAVRVRLTEAGGTRELFLGKSSGAFGEHYVSAGPDAPILAASASFPPVTLGANDWRSREALVFVPQKVMEITLSGRTSYALKKEADGTWRMTAPEAKPLAAGEVADFLATLESVRLTSFADAGASVDPVLTLTLKQDGLPDEVLAIGKEQGETFLAKNGARDAVFLLSKGDVDVIERPSLEAPSAVPPSSTPAS